MTPDLLRAATGCTPSRAELFAPHLTAACQFYGITSAKRLAAFLPQIAHESGSLTDTRERWGPTPEQSRYEGRIDLGNVQPGDGPRYRGRGLIQCTGRDNYRAMARELQGHDAPDFEDFPEALEEPKWAAWSAAAWWAIHGCNELADRGEYVAIGRLINRGNAASTKPANGEADRLARWERAKAALQPHHLPDAAAPAPPAPPAPEPTMPPGEAPDWTPPPPPPPPKESTMAPFIAAALSAILGAAPELIDTFKGDSKSATRNAEAAKVVVGIAKETLGATNEQEVVERIQSDPAAAEAVRKAMQERWFEIHKATEKSVADARTFVNDYSARRDVRTVVGNFTFVEVLTLFLAISGVLGGLAVLKWGEVGPELKGAIITLILIESVVGIRKFWFGNSGPDNSGQKSPTS